MIQLINLSWILVLTGSFAVYFASPKHKSNLAILALLLNVLVTGVVAANSLLGHNSDLNFDGGGFIGDIHFVVDKLSAWFILIINFTSLMGIVYGKGYLQAYTNSPRKLTLHWILFLIFHFSMVWVCMLQNSIAFLIVWELMSLSSMMLVIFDHENPKTLKAGLNYLVQMHISVIFLTIGFIWLYFETGTFSFDAFETFFSSNPNGWLFLIFFVGFGLKSGFIPLHSWLPKAHPAAPSHVSGVMSGVIVKLGIYGIFRVVSYLQADLLLISQLVIIISVFTGLYGILNAAMHRDFKKMLAYCTIENIGIIGIGMGIGIMGMALDMPILYYLGFGGALLHVLNHSLFKSLLFFSAGSVYQQTHTRDMEKLGGLIKSMPKSAFTFLIGSLAIGGMPPFNGFISEFLIYNGLIQGMHGENLPNVLIFVTAFAGLSIIGGLSIITFTKSFGVIFLGSPRQKLHEKPHEVSKIMLIPQYVIIAFMVSIVLFPAFYMGILNQILSEFTYHHPIAPQSFNSYFSTIQQISLYSILFFALIAVVLFFRQRLLQPKLQAQGATWGCGYTAGNSRQQYTGKSFSKSLSKMFNAIVLERKENKIIEKGEIFPITNHYVSHYHDFFEDKIIHKITNQLLYAVNYFKFIQNGRIQSYVLYGIVFILLIFLLTIFNIVI